MKENMGGNFHRRSPEVAMRTVEASGAKPFEILTNQVPENVIVGLMKNDKALMQALEAAKWPTDEDTCDKIGERVGLGAEQVAAVAKYQRAIEVERRETIH
jgi:hypothetical protein